MKPRNFVIVTVFILLAGGFVLIAQDSPKVESDQQKIGKLEQEVTNLQNELRVLQTGDSRQFANEEIMAPRPENAPLNQQVSNEPMPNSVYAVQPPTQPMLPPNNNFGRQSGYSYGNGYGYGYDQPMPDRPWAIEPPTYAVPTPVTQYVPVQVPVYVETTPCWVDYGPVYDPFFQPAVGLNFWFGGSGNGKHNKHRD